MVQVSRFRVRVLGFWEKAHGPEVPKPVACQRQVYVSLEDLYTFDIQNPLNTRPELPLASSKPVFVVVPFLFVHCTCTYDLGITTATSIVMCVWDVLWQSFGV